MGTGGPALPRTPVRMAQKEKFKEQSREQDEKFKQAAEKQDEENSERLKVLDAQMEEKARLKEQDAPHIGNFPKT